MRVYLSSTWDDLAPYRQKVIEALEKLRLNAFADLDWFGMEGFCADSTRNPLGVSLEYLSRCDLYVGVLARRYGSIPPDKNLSYVELEYEVAVTRDLPRLLFLMRDGCDEWRRLGEEPDEEKRAKLEELRARFARDRLLEHFDSAADLATKVTIALLSDLISERDQRSIDHRRLTELGPARERAATITLNVSPSTVVADGASSATVTADVKHADGSLVADGEPLRWEVLGGAVAVPINSEARNGQASTEITPLSSSKPSRLIVIGIAPHLGVSNSVYISCLPAGLEAAVGLSKGTGQVGALREGDNGIEVQPRVAGQWALLDVTNVGPDTARFRAEGHILRGSKESEESYSVQWRESQEAMMPIEGRGGHHILNVASASVGPLPGGDLRYTHFTFHTARIPRRQGQFTERFKRTQEDYVGFVLELRVTADPPLRTPLVKRYLLRAADEPDWIPLQDALEKGSDALASAKIEFREIDPSEERSLVELAGVIRQPILGEDDQDMPRFSASLVASTRLEQQFTPVFRIRQLSGMPVAGLRWRFRGPRFLMGWEQTSGEALARRHFSRSFDLTAEQQVDDKLGTDEMGIEIRFPWGGAWAHELHRWPLQRRELPHKVLWDIEEERLPPQTWAEPN